MQATGLRTHVWNNALKSMVLLALFPVLVAILTHSGLMIRHAAVSDALLKRDGLMSAIGQVAVLAWRDLPPTLPWVGVGCLVWFAIAWFANTGIVAASTGAKSVTRRDEPELHNLLENLCISRGMTTPKLRIIETDALNAYASGLTRKQYTVAVTRGLMRTLTADEMEAVLAHELAHIEHGDARLMMVTGVFVGIFSLLAEIVLNSGRGMLRAMARPRKSSSGGKKGGGGPILLLAVVAIGVVILLVVRLLAMLTRLSISRSREYMADSQAVLTTRNPAAMISALRTIAGRSSIAGVPSDVKPMFFDNAPAFKGDIFSTHPSIDERIARIARLTRTSSTAVDGGPRGDLSGLTARV